MVLYVGDSRLPRRIFVLTLFSLLTHQNRRINRKVKESLHFALHEDILREWTALNGGEWSASCPGLFVPEERTSQYPLNRGLLVDQNRSARLEVEKMYFSCLDSALRLYSPFPSHCVACTVKVTRKFMQPQQ